MPRDARSAAAQQAAEDDFYEEGEDEGLGSDEGASGEREQGPQGRQQSEGAAVDLGEEQEARGDEDVDYDEFLDPDPAPRGRRDTRVQNLVNERNDLARRVADLERSTRPAQPTGPVGQREETEADFQARIANLPPDERMEARHIRWQREQDQRNFTTQLQAAELADRTAYDAKMSSDGRYARWKDRVEEEAAKLRQVGQYAPRENILAYLIGKHVLSSQGTKGTKKARDAATRRVERQTVRPANAGSDVRPQRRGQLSEREARARRLEGVQL